MNRVVVHCMAESDWLRECNQDLWGNISISQRDCVHCTPPQYLWRVVHNFAHSAKKMVMIVVSFDKIDAPIKTVDFENTGRIYYHVFGPISARAVLQVLPLQFDENGEWIRPDCFVNIKDK